MKETIQKKLMIAFGLIVTVALVLASFATFAEARYVRDLADGEEVNNTADMSVYRFEWFGDVCYKAVGYNGNLALSCLKKQ